MTRIPLALVLGLALTLPACARDVASDDTPAAPSPGGPTGSPMSSASAVPPPANTPPTAPSLSDPPVVGKNRGSVTVTGTAVAGVEAGCLLLETGAETLQLIGAPPDSVEMGSRLRVTGTRSPELMTTCQQGTPFQVRDVQPAD